MALLQLGFTYLPGMQQVFHSRSLAWLDWIPILMVGASIALMVSLEKWLLDRCVPSQLPRSRKHA
jgi:Ca2+-transporting ATPase